MNNLNRTKFENLEISVLANKNNFSKYFDSIQTLKMYGIIGNEFERIKVHIESVEKVKSSDLIYKISGKTKVNKNISKFEGELLLQNMYEFKEKITGHGLVICKFAAEFTEEGIGQHKGKFIGNYYLILSKIMDVITYPKVTPQFMKNHTFSGKWISNDKKLENYVYWGEDYLFEELQDVFYGITNSQEIDESLFEDSWKTYFDAYSLNLPKHIRDESLKIEEEVWWK
jgi:hypothetical protein